MKERWFDDAAGPVVRPYTMTRGRTRAASGAMLDLIALVVADHPPGAEPAGAEGEVLLDDRLLAPEHVDIVARCRYAPQSVAELAAELDLPVGVVRVLLGDLVDAALVRVSRPVRPAELPDEGILREVIDGLRAL